MQSTEYLAIACIIVPVIALGVKRMRDRAQELHAAYKVRRVLGRKKNVHRKRGDVVQELLAIDNDTFERMFRMPKDTFMQLEQSIAPILREVRRWTVQSEQMAVLSSGSAVQSLILLAATIRLCYVGWCFFFV
jgi:tRNA/tmRNA/rRNA uracil-C5-methylase (TrmA/RlmC/RlmD family)